MGVSQIGGRKGNVSVISGLYDYFKCCISLSSILEVK